VNKNKLNHIISNLDSLDNTSLSDIKLLTEEFPYCQIGHTINAMVHKKLEHMLSDEKIVHAAVHISNRKHLKTLIQHHQPIITKEATEPTNTIKTIVQEEIPEMVIVYQELINIQQKRDTINEELEQSLLALRKNKEALADLESKEKNITNFTADKGTVETENNFNEDKKEKLINTKTPLESTIMANRSPQEHAYSFNEIMLEYLEILEKKKENTLIIQKNNSQSSIIDNFIENKPNIPRGNIDKKITHTEDLSKESVVLKNHFISENLAKINVKQGNISKAINIYEQLILKNPEKKTYFAKKIEKLKSL